MDFIDPVGGQHTGAAAIGDDGQALAHRAVARGQAFGSREQLHKRSDTHGAGAAQGGIKHIVATDNGTAVGLRGLVAGRFASGLEHDHRFGIGRRAQRAHEAPGVGDAFEVHDDALRARIVGQIVQHLGNVHGRIRAQGDDAGKAHRILVGPVQHGGGECAGLRHQRQRTGLGQGTGDAGIELQQRILKAQAVGAQQLHVFALGHFFQRRCQLKADAAGDDQRRATGHAPGHLQRSQHVLRRQGNDGQIGTGLRQLGQGTAGVDVQKVQLTLEFLRLQVFGHLHGLQGMALVAVGGAGKDQNRLGGKEGSEVVFVHKFNLRLSAP